MANVKISALTELTAPASGDYIPIVDISEAADADKTKRITLDTLHFPVFLTSPLTSTDYDGDAFSTTAKTLIDLSAVFSVPAGVSAISAYLHAKDSGSAAGAAWAGLSPTTDSYSLLNHLQGVTNDIPRAVSGVVPCTTDGDVYFDCVATGAGTLDVTLQIWGYWL